MAKISVIMPVYNSEKTLEKSLKSIFNNNYKDFEVIVVDDKSSDNSVEIAKKFPCKIIKLEKNHGGGYARNAGAKAAKGEILLFVDSDIIIPESCMQFGVDIFSKNKDISAMLGLFSSKIPYKNFFSNYKHLYLRYYFLKQGSRTHTLNTSLTFIKKEVFEKFNGFNENIKSVISEDAELGMRLTDNNHIIYQSKELQMEHMKFYNFKDFLKTEFIRSRRIFLAFAEKFFEKKKIKDNTKKSGKKFFFFKPVNIYLSIPLVYIMIIFLLFSLLNAYFFAGFLISLSLFIAINFNYWKFLKNERNIIFSVKSAFVNFLSMFWMGIGIAFGLFDFFMKFNKGGN